MLAVLLISVIRYSDMLELRRPADGWTRFALHGTQAAPPVAVVISFIDCINRGDADGLGSLMTDDHELDVFEEEQLRGKVLSIEAWRGYEGYSRGPFLW